MSVGHVCLYQTLSRELVLEPNSIRKRYPRLVFCIVGLKVHLKDHFPWIWVHDFKVDTPTQSKENVQRLNISAP